MGTFTDRLTQAGWLPARARARLTADITARNALDRTLAAAKGLDPADPKCARFQGPELQHHLDRAVRAARRGGAAK